jgi:hypothetical protein
MTGLAHNLQAIRFAEQPLTESRQVIELIQGTSPDDVIDDDIFVCKPEVTVGA